MAWIVIMITVPSATHRSTPTAASIAPDEHIRCVPIYRGGKCGSISSRGFTWRAVLRDSTGRSWPTSVSLC